MILFQEINCGSPPDIDKALKTSNGTVYNSVTTYTCESGYVVSTGTTTSTCKISGWSETNLQCVGEFQQPVVYLVFIIIIIIVIIIIVVVVVVVII